MERGRGKINCGDKEGVWKNMHRSWKNFVASQVLKSWNWVNSPARKDRTSAIIYLDSKSFLGIRYVPGETLTVNRVSLMSWVLRGDQAKKETEGPAPYLWGKPVYSQETE